MKKLAFILAILAISISSYAQNTKLKTTAKKGDLLEVKLYYNSGELMQHGFYTDDGKILHGSWESFNEDGTRQCVAFYQKGVKVGTWMYYKKDEITKVTYDNNKITNIEKINTKEVIDF
ncbi:hypothetical protein SAMN05444411_10876 [Lutibacter oricola]|uniref:MORN repeat variant n=1 Tax=Lutibacter oricola TaxID=762486 RepID=A0A1H3DVB7_9FLAO|nr:hypothetical protein [Lutibacter oricola]SDX70058.1 hypothetical protein SAMN05444411_10876 [Lutibacter oricola]